jgi:hypothetical protein
VLGLMNKGTRTLENIRLLKWCRTYGVIPLWNIIYGLPGEIDDDYENLLSLLPAIRFLRPPEGCGQLRLDRHSPFYDAPARFGFRDVAPLERYSSLYPFGRSSLERIACSFAFTCDPTCLGEDQRLRLHDGIRQWQKGYSFGALHMLDHGDGTLQLLDRRSGATQRTRTLTAFEALIYRSCEDIASVEDLKAIGRREYPELLSIDQDVAACLWRFEDWQVVVRVNERYLALALPEEIGWSHAIGSGSLDSQLA